MYALSNACLIILHVPEESQPVTILKYVTNRAVWFDVGIKVGRVCALPAAA
jgi:hypothetical protein